MRFSQPTTKNVSNVIRIVKVTGYGTQKRVSYEV